MFDDYKIAYMREHVKVKEAQRLGFLRQSVSYMLSQTARKVPQVAGVSQMDVTPLVEYGKAADRKADKTEVLDQEGLQKRALNRNFSAFFLKALAHGLSHVPCLNGFLDYKPWGGGGTFYVAEDINLSFTVHTKYGVLKPVIRNPHLKTLDEVAKEMRNLTRRARRTDPEELYMRAAKEYIKTGIRHLDLRGLSAVWMYLRHLLFPSTARDPKFKDVPEEMKLQPEEILGATVTVANIGMMVRGHQTVTVLIPPEVAMFGIGDLHLTPMVIDGEVVPRYAVTLCVTMDHRPYDAGEAFPLYGHIKRYLADPTLIYGWVPGDEI